ncbi:heterokaryon incompatibility (het-6OR allele) [Fusarium heterosporum]|uniref:Heterokaryon incompatibility (Het-6OR allele) n=1 Tax=Fusarium heterosporum TaxID=42747 RepID=A0A8H5WED7_FUSHE|nr:heterokaryon incompatibility (het-6OR allele) [Fusarium heterosporum]
MPRRRKTKPQESQTNDILTGNGSLRYLPLDLERDQIRTLHLLPGNQHDSVRCTLRTAFLDDNPKYEALSYTWGDPQDYRYIKVDGMRKEITVNLYNALYRLRDSKQERCLWVDAVCIDQNDDAEKSQQVNLMTKIYSQTERAILWLGDFSEHLDITTNHFPREKATDAFNFLTSVVMPNHENGSLGTDEDHELIQRGPPAFLSLLQLPWWHRAWTVQEAVLPSDAIVVCGNLEMPFSLFPKLYSDLAIHYYNNCCEWGKTLSVFWEQMHALLNACDDYHDDSINIHKLLNTFRSRHASNPRDKVYAYLGLCPGISTDYKMPHEEVFKQLVRTLIKDTGTLDALLRTTEDVRSATLPTWAPDWCAEFDLAMYQHDLSRFYLYNYYIAAGETKAETRIPSRDCELDLQGVILDRISKIGCLIESDKSAKEAVDKWDEDHSGEYPTGGTYREAAWGTVLGAVMYMEDVSFRRLNEDDDPEQVAAYQLARDPGGSSLGSFHQLPFSTEKGMLGFGGRNLKVGDTICVLAGGRMPFVLRQVSAPGSNYMYIGPAYVHGIMDGEVLESVERFDWITLV